MPRGGGRPVGFFLACAATAMRLQEHQPDTRRSALLLYLLPAGRLLNLLICSRAESAP